MRLLTRLYGSCIPTACCDVHVQCSIYSTDRPIARARDVTGRARWSALEDNWSRFLWGKCTVVAFAACLQRTQASAFLIVAVCWTTHSVFRDVSLLAGV